MLTPAGAVLSFGDGWRGKLGLGGQDSSTLPTVVGGSLAHERVVAIAAGNVHSAALTDSGDLYCFGKWAGDEKVPRARGGALVQCGALRTTRVVSVAAGAGHTLSLTADGELFSFGSNNRGQLGLGDQTPRAAPTRVTAALSGKRVARVASGGND